MRNRTTEPQWHIIPMMIVMIFCIMPVKVTAEETQGTPPANDGYDWLQLTSGEWLKGTVKSMYNDVLEFDSEHLELLDIDMEDIARLDVRQRMDVNIEHVGIVTGSVQIRRQQVIILHGGTRHVSTRQAVISFSPASQKEIRLWSIKIGLSMDFRRGNADQSDITALVNARRRSATSRYTFTYTGNLSRSRTNTASTVETANNHRVTAEADIFASRRLFYRLISGEYYRDPIQNIDQRLSAYSGIGYTLYDSARSEWDMIGGVAWLGSRFVSVPAGRPSREQAVGLVFETTLDTEITQTLDFQYQYNMKLMQRSVGGYIHHMTGTLSSDITKRLDLEVSLIWDRTSQPAANSQGIRPRPDDMRLLVGLGFEI